MDVNLCHSWVLSESLSQNLATDRPTDRRTCRPTGPSRPKHVFARHWNKNLPALRHVFCLCTRTSQAEFDSIRLQAQLYLHSSASTPAVMWLALGPGTRSLIHLNPSLIPPREKWERHLSCNWFALTGRRGKSLPPSISCWFHHLRLISFLLCASNALKSINRRVNKLTLQAQWRGVL